MRSTPLAMEFRQFFLKLHAWKSIRLSYSYEIDSINCELLCVIVNQYLHRNFTLSRNVSSYPSTLSQQRWCSARILLLCRNARGENTRKFHLTSNFHILIFFWREICLRATLKYGTEYVGCNTILLFMLWIALNQICAMMTIFFSFFGESAGRSKLYKCIIFPWMSFGMIFNAFAEQCWCHNIDYFDNIEYGLKSS